MSLLMIPAISFLTVVVGLAVLAVVVQLLN